MPTKNYEGRAVDVDAEGYLARASDWSPDMGDEIAAELGVPMSPASWKVIEFVRADFESQGQTPGLRRITAHSGVSIKDLYALFPKGPVKLIARIAGTPKPKSCL